MNTEQHILDALAGLQVKIGNTPIDRERLLVTLLPPPSDPNQREQLRHQLDELVPELLLRHSSPGALPPSYVLSREGWLRTSHAPTVMRVIRAFLDAFRSHVTRGEATGRVSWANLVEQGLTDSDYHLACIVAVSFDLHAGFSTQTWNGKTTPSGSWTLPIDLDELLDIGDPNDLVSRRRSIPYERLHARKTIAGEVNGHIRKAVERIYKYFDKTGTWPLTRSLHIELAKEGIDLEQIATGRFIQGCDPYTEGSRTSITLAGLLFASGAHDDRQSVVNVLRFVGEYSRTHAEQRTVNAPTVMDQLTIDDVELVHVAKLLQLQRTAYVTTGSGSFDIDKILFYLGPEFVGNAEAKDLWDVVLNEEVRRLRAIANTLDSASSAHVMHLDADEAAEATGGPAARKKQDKFEILDSPRHYETDFPACVGVLGVAVIYFDLDGFKKLNTRFTEAVIDELLLPDLHRLIDQLSFNRGYAYAEGGDEFVILLPNTNQALAEAFTTVLLEAICSKTFDINGEQVTVTASAGIAVSRNPADVKECRRLASAAKQAAKDQGKDRYVVSA